MYKNFLDIIGLTKSSQKNDGCCFEKMYFTAHTQINFIFNKMYSNIIYPIEKIRIQFNMMRLKYFELLLSLNTQYIVICNH